MTWSMTCHKITSGSYALQCSQRDLWSTLLVLCQSSFLSIRSSWVKSSANQSPISLHMGESLVCCQISSITSCLANRTTICKFLFSSLLPTWWTISSILFPSSGATFYSSWTVSSLMFSSIFSFHPLIHKHHLLSSAFSSQGWPTSFSKVSPLLYILSALLNWARLFLSD